MYMKCYLFLILIFELHITPLHEFVTNRQVNCGNHMRIGYIIIIGNQHHDVEFSPTDHHVICCAENTTLAM